MPFKNPHPLYSTWQKMRQRCRNPNYRQWNDYGGRGIDICSRWDGFHAFVEDMGPRPKGYSLDRIDNDKGYSPDNCRWADKKTQQRNQRVTRHVEIDGKRYIAVVLAELAGLKTDAIIERASRGLSYDEVISPQKRVYKEGLALGGLANGARIRAKTHCKRGHEFTPENTYITKEGWRNCRQCQNAKMRRLNARKRAACA